MMNLQSLRDSDFNFGIGLLESIDQEFAEAEEMLNRVLTTVRDIKPEDLATNFPYFYGYEVSVGPNGKPHVRAFGNIKPTAKGWVSLSESRQPLADIGID